MCSVLSLSIITIKAWVDVEYSKISYIYFPPNYFSLFRQGKADLKWSVNNAPGHQFRHGQIYMDQQLPLTIVK
jgi:hypothetical protein